MSYKDRCRVYLSFLVIFASSTPLLAKPAELFDLGVKNGLFTDFDQRSVGDRSVVFTVGKSSPERDWPAYQPGSFDSVVIPSTMKTDWIDGEPNGLPRPFQVLFQLSSRPRGTFILHLDAIFRYRHPAPPLYTLLINGKFEARYRLKPAPAPQLWWPNGGEAEGDTQYFGYESIDMELPASAFVAGLNSISMQCLDGFGIYYDHLSLANDLTKKTPLITEASVEPTVLYKMRSTGLVELAIVSLRTTQRIPHLVLEAKIGSAIARSTLSQVQAGDASAMIEVPAIAMPVPVSLRLAGRKRPLYQSTFVAKRQWRVYALPMEQADFGYNDLPARTLEWENRFIDRALEIQKRYPSYRFTLDASANLESYLSTRRHEKGEELISLLQDGKWGMNALYANFFTGLSTPEELIQTLHFSRDASRKYSFPLDAASQTDEPSVTSSLPQVLASAGISYFTNGSDPIRGAFNPIGLLNFRSPFYWETPSGSKILVWSGVSYTAVDDLTWGGWNEESVRSHNYASSIFGLTRSLPLVLSQFERLDYPFDAVLLYGLHNDEISMRHWGDADNIELWNREYAYPKIIPALQRDFFTHITSNFEGKIKTFRGDGGAYWEDEAGADARVAASIRNTQTQLTSAESFESIAHWLEPHLDFDRGAFDKAWKDLLLADSYVWSDANSFKRPESYRTLGGESAHRAWAQAAAQQSSDLLLVAADKISDLIQTNQQGAVVFNSESWTRNDLFDFELEPDEKLIDSATEQAIPCGVLKILNGYQKVRCWASSVPALGYKFYAITKGQTAQGKPLTIDPSFPVVENRYYKAEFNPKSGALAHLVDKSTGKDLIDSGAPFQLNQFLYVSGGDPDGLYPGSSKDNRILAADVTLSLPKLTLATASVTEPIEATQFPWGISVLIHAQATNTPKLQYTVTLPEFTKSVEIEDQVEKTSTLHKEGIYFAFPFALKRPEIKYQTATSWVNPERDMLPGANRQWFATQGAVWASDQETQVAWATADAPLITIGDINRGLWPENIDIENGTLFSYVMNNYWYTDAPAQQGGRFRFRYAFTSGADVSTGRATRLASGQRSPLFAVRRYSMGWQPTLSPRGASFLSADPEGIRVLTIRPLDNGDAYLVRILNSTSEAADAHLTFPTNSLGEAFTASLSGDRIGPADWTPHGISVAMGPSEIKTLVVKVANK